MHKPETCKIYPCSGDCQSQQQTEELQYRNMLPLIRPYMYSDSIQILPQLSAATHGWSGDTDCECLTLYKLAIKMTLLSHPVVSSWYEYITPGAARPQVDTCSLPSFCRPSAPPLCMGLGY